MAGIDGLPLNTEGYERAKNILQGEYGKTSATSESHVEYLNSHGLSSTPNSWGPEISLPTGSHQEGRERYPQILLESQ